MSPVALQATCLLRALTRCDDREAQRLVFLGWPGQNEPEDEEEEYEGEDQEEDEEEEEGARGGSEGAAGPQGEEEAGPPPRRSLPGSGARVSHDASALTAGGMAGGSGAGGVSSSPYDFVEALPADVTARPPRAVTEEMSKTQVRWRAHVESVVQAAW